MPTASTFQGDPRVDLQRYIAELDERLLASERAMLREAGRVVEGAVQSAVTVSATVDDATATSVVATPAFSVSVSSAYSEVVSLTFSAPQVETAGVVSASITLTLWRELAGVGTNLGRIARVGPSPAASPLGMPVRVVVLNDAPPTSGSYTYRVRAFQSGGAGTVWAGAGGSGVFVPARLRALTEVA